MKTFKKLFAFSAIFALLATLMPVHMVNANYSDELNEAYTYAHSKGITTMSSIENADMYGSLTRVAMAKMMANFALDQGLTPDTTMECNFPDVSAALDAQYDNGVTNACQLGLMGVGITNFNPYGIVTRAEFGTVLSRALYGDTHNDSDPYYAAHLQALNDAGIMNNISNPMAKEVRGYVMLMMMRGDDSYVSTAGCSAEELLACITADDYDDCIAECSGEDEEDDTTVVLDGDLEISEGSMPNNGSSIPNAGIVSFGEMDLDADGADINVFSMEFVREGLGERTDIDRVWMELDGKRVTGKAAVQANGVISMSFAPALVVKRNETLEFVVSLNSTGAGSEHMFRLTDVDSSAEDADFNWESPTLRTAKYNIAEVKFHKLTNTLIHKASDHDIELGRFELTNENVDERLTTFKSITLRQKGNADLENLEDLDLYLNSDKVSTKTSIDGKYVTFTLDEDLDVNRTYRFYIRGNVNAVSYEEGDTYQFELRNDEDMTVVETNTNFRASINGSESLSEYTVEGADVMLSTNSDLESRTASAGSTEEIMLGQIQVRSPALFETTDSSSTGVVTINSSTDDIRDIVSKVTLTIGSSTATWTPEDVSNNTGQTIKIDGTFYVNQKVDVSMKVYLKANYTGSDSLSVTSLGSDSFDIIEYVSNENSAKDSVVGQIDGVNLNVLESTAYLTRTDGFSTKNVVKGTNNVSLFEGELVTTTNSTINISSITLTGSDSGSGFSDNMTVTLYVDGNPVRTTNYRSEEALFTTNFDVTKDDSADIQIVANILSSISANISDKFTVSFAGTDNYSDVENYEETATFDIKAEGSAILAKNTSENNSKLIAANQIGLELGKFDIEASNDDLRLRELFVENLSGGAILNDRFNSFELVVGEVVVPGMFVDEDVKFDARSYDIVVPSDDTITAIVRANSNNITSDNDVTHSGVLLKATGIDMISTSVGGNPITVIGGVISPDTPHMLVRGGVFASDVDGFVNSLTNVAKFNIMAVNNKVSLSGLTLEVSTSGITPGSVKVYNGTTLLGTGDAVTGAVVVSFTNTFDVTTNSDLTVKFEGNSGIDNPYYEVTLKDIHYVDNFISGVTGYVASVKDYDNVNLPITSVYGN